MKNQVQLITYADRLTGNGLTQLKQLLDDSFGGLFSGVHILPFYYPIDGSDAGFDPIDHTQVDSRLGTWQALSDIGQSYEVMADLIVNHVSAQSDEFQDVLAQGHKSPYWSMFLKETDVFPDGITQAQASAIFRPRPTSCFSPKKLASGEVVNFWTTFTDNQIDINVESDSGKRYLDSVLNLFANNGVKIIRLDAAGFAIKRAGTSCFMSDETFVFIQQLAERARRLGMETIAEIHSHYKTQIAVAKKVDRVYDFALPPLVLHTLFSKNVDALVSWLAISPRNCLTVLDTHDGIGIVDAGPEGDKSGLLNANEIDELVQQIHVNSQGESLKATGAAASNVDLYQVNCTYYDALGKDDLAYLTARAIQFFSPGVPQVYYVGLLALNNDMALLEKTQVGRDINRSYLSLEQVHMQLDKPVVKGLCELIKLRNESNAFNGEFSVQGAHNALSMKWQNLQELACLDIDFIQGTTVLSFSCAKQNKVINLADLLR
ncbi:sucrose phosphorylase [Pseudoalteromonas sp. S16_S37]|uniref:sucrose phosphorylase n=1 Tax=Pseudoalteromonas sp. S16_S37 TaxID=2720228 RepID=UPI0016813767|nr:sucrose phosphorylase [Pseudoalteromonas sp. S16_S37]MBD1582086.1 sucrose phosphorylase [Pseudoalteromonas sp. S16_S37]